MNTEKYHVDISSTRKFWEENDWQCDCVYCQNYRKAFPVCFPETVKILESLGLEYDHALEIMDLYWNDAGDKRRYSSYYPVQGTLLEDGYILCETDVVIRFFQPDSPKLSCPKTRMEPPWFMVELAVQLPWVLEEQP